MDWWFSAWIQIPIGLFQMLMLYAPHGIKRFVTCLVISTALVFPLLLLISPNLEGNQAARIVTNAATLLNFWMLPRPWVLLDVVILFEEKLKPCVRSIQTSQRIKHVTLALGEIAIFILYVVFTFAAIHTTLDLAQTDYKLTGYITIFSVIAASPIVLKWKTAGAIFICVGLLAAPVLTTLFPPSVVWKCNIKQTALLFCIQTYWAVQLLKSSRGAIDQAFRSFAFRHQAQR